MPAEGLNCDTKKAFDAIASLATLNPNAAVTDNNANADSSSLSAPSIGIGSVGATLGFPTGYGFVVFTAIGSIMLVKWKDVKVGIARNEFKIPHPQMYSSDNVAFNCVMRAHQNTMESYPQFLLLLMIGGLEMPYFSTFAGCVWMLGRIMYAKGYYTGNPTKRAQGTISALGTAMLLAATVKFALKHLRN